MKAVIQNSYTGVNGLTVNEINESKITPLSVIIENKFTPVLPYDWMTEYGQLKAIRPVKLPMVVGYGFGGIVQKTGMLRDRRLIGKKVIGANPGGAVSEIINSQIPPLLFEVPDNVDLADVTTLTGGADAAMHAIRVANIVKEDVVLVTGASGGVGTYLLQMLRSRGAKVIALASTDNEQFIQSVGADWIVNYETNFIDQLGSLVPPTKAIDTVGSPVLLRQISDLYDDLKILSLSLTDFKPAKEGQSFRFSHRTIGVGGYKKLLNLLSEQKIKPYIQEKFRFTDVREAHLVSKEQHSQGRILLEF